MLRTPRDRVTVTDEPRLATTKFVVEGRALEPRTSACKHTALPLGTRLGQRDPPATERRLWPLIFDLAAGSHC